MAIKIIRQSNKRINYLMIDFYHLIILSIFTLMYVAYFFITNMYNGILRTVTPFIMFVFFYYVLFAKLDGENNIISSIIRKLKYITKKKYFIKEKGEFDLWE